MNAIGWQYPIPAAIQIEFVYDISEIEVSSEPRNKNKTYKETDSESLTNLSYSMAHGVVLEPVRCHAGCPGSITNGVLLVPTLAYGTWLMADVTPLSGYRAIPLVGYSPS